jgi:hypothetical protein
MKSHWHMVATLSVKNVLMASPWNGKRHDYKNQYEKVKMHGNRWNERNNEFLSQNLPIMAGFVFPDFGFIDGFEGMEGNGPEQGTPVSHRIAIAGPDAIAVDRMGAELMGIHPHYLRYVANCAAVGKGNWDCANINVIGAKPENHIRKYQWADEIEDQIGWLGPPPPSVCTFNQLQLSAVREPRPPRRLHVDMPHSANTHMAIYNLRGRKVRQLLAHTLPAGRRPISWDELDDNGRRVPPGHYILQLRTGAGMVSKRLTVSPLR